MFAHHFSGQGTAEALGVYRSEFRPSDLAAEPVTFMTVNAVVAPTRSEAEALLLPNLQLMARLRTGQPLGPLDLVEDAATTTMAPQAGAIVAAARDRAVVGAPAEAADQIRSLADEFDVDEVMVNPVASAHRGTDPGPPQTASSPSNCWPGTVLAAAASPGRRVFCPPPSDSAPPVDRESLVAGHLGCQPDHRDRPRRQLLIGAVTPGVLVVAQLPQPGVVRVVGQHHLRPDG